jgi:acyl dehydratase
VAGDKKARLLLTLNIQQVHFDAAYAAKSEWKKMLVDSTFTLALLTGMSVRTVSAKVVASLGWNNVKATHPVFAGDIATRSGAIEEVVRLFAVFHDSRREHDGWDDKHGGESPRHIVQHQ